MFSIQRLLLSAVGFSLFAGLLSAAEKEPVMGVPPAALLGYLPAVPVKWKLQSSMGTNEVSAFPALLTFAIREYQFIPPPPADPALPIPPPQNLKLVLLDTADDPDRGAVFDVFSEKESRKPKKHYQLGVHPVVDQAVSATKRRLLIPFNDRFLLSIFLENMDDKAVEEFLQTLNLDGLATKAKSAPRDKPTPEFFKVAYVDELDPKKNQEAQMPYLTAEQQAAEAARFQRERPKDQPLTEPGR